MYTETNRRPFKGRSLLEIPQDYTVIDTETTGYDPYRDEIIELGALRVRGGKIVDSFSSLVRPGNSVSDFITELTGISNAELQIAEEIDSVLPRFLDFVGDDVVVGHYVHFDVNFVYDAAAGFCGRVFSNDMVDTLRLCRRALPDLEHHRLSDVAAALGAVQEGEHRSLLDCYTTYNVLQALAVSGVDFSSEPKKHHSHQTKAADIIADEQMQQPDNPLFGKVCVFTGALEIPRREAMQAVADIGGICGDSITKKTNFLILGNNDYCTTIKDGKSAKQKKAESLILQGQDLEILSESVFYDLIHMYDE